jgi:hypothetical protein
MGFLYFLSHRQADFLHLISNASDSFILGVPLTYWSPSRLQSTTTEMFDPDSIALPSTKGTHL